MKEYAGMSEWPCELRAQEPDPDRLVAPTVLIQGGEQSPLGTISSKSPEKIMITYNPAIIANPNKLVATFAHELAHYLTVACKEPPPGGWDNWEFATDITAVFMGFGIFQANAAFEFTQHSDIFSQGWQCSSSGYLSEEELSFALALFIRLKEINPKKVYPYLDTNIKTYVKKSIKELKGSLTLADLKQVEYSGDERNLR